MHGDLGDLSKTRLKGLVLPFRNATIDVQFWHFLQRIMDTSLCRRKGREAKLIGTSRATRELMCPG